MSKINCEVCGTVYPDNASACPICGTARPSGENVQAPADTPEKTVERVKGGRFSHRNVKKRKKAAQKAELAGQSAAPRASEKEEKPESSGSGMKVVVAILLAAVILVGVYIGIRFWQGRDAYNKTYETKGTETTETTESTPPAEVACTGLTIGDVDPETGIELQGEGRAWRLDIVTEPADTTDLITIVSSDESVAKVVVSEQYVEIVAVAPGTAEITVTCGSVEQVFPVSCVFETEPVTEETTEPTTEATIEPASSFQLNRTDITFFSEGESFTFSAGEGISVAQVTWASEDETVATINASGRVTAVGEGMTTITATYNGETQKCIIRCSFPDETEETEETEETTEGDSEEWYITYEDVTIDVGETFTLRIRNAAGDTAPVSWSFSASGIVTMDGNTVKGAASGVTTATATYNGVTYKCIIRVR